MRTIMGLIAAAALFSSNSPVNAQQFCAPREQAVTQLHKQFEEKAFGRGLLANGKQMIELFVSESGSWTVLVSDPKGRTCIIATGQDWQGTRVLVGDPA